MANECCLFFLFTICMKWTKASLLLRTFHCCTQSLPWSLPLPWWHRREECMFGKIFFFPFSSLHRPQSCPLFSLSPFSHFSPPFSHLLSLYFFHTPLFRSVTTLPSSSASASFSSQGHRHHHSLLHRRSQQKPSSPTVHLSLFIYIVTLHKKKKKKKC